MKRYLIDVYASEIPLNAKQRRDDISATTEDWINAKGRTQCYQFQLQGDSLQDLAEQFSRLHSHNTQLKRETQWSRFQRPFLLALSGYLHVIWTGLML